MRAVFDTNVILSGLLWSGSTAELFRFVEAGDVTLCLTPNILNEIERILQYPKLLKPLRAAGFSVKDVIEHISRYALIFEDVSFVAPIHDDPSDNMFVNCALVSRSRWIVSGDQHLLKLKEFASIQIVTPRKFLEIAKNKY